MDFLKTWADQVDARAEVASSLKTTIAQTVQTTLTAQNVDKETVQRKADLYSAMATNITLNGLQKMNSYWLKTRRLKTGVKKAKSDGDYEYKTTYMVAFAIDSNVYSQQLKVAIADVKDNDEATPLLRTALTEKCTETLGVEAAASVEPNIEIAAVKTAPALLMEMHASGGKRICPNVDFYSGFVYSMLDIPRELHTAIFAISRIAGWSAHRMEEIVAGERIFRPAFKNISEVRQYIKIGDRA